MPDKKLFEIALRNDSNARGHDEHLWIVASNSEIAISKALRYGRKRYGQKQTVYRLEQHGTVDVL